MNNDLMQKLVVAKKIMDKHNEVPRGNAINTSILFSLFFKKKYVFSE